MQIRLNDEELFEALCYAFGAFSSRSKEEVEFVLSLPRSYSVALNAKRYEQSSDSDNVQESREGVLPS